VTPGRDKRSAAGSTRAAPGSRAAAVLRPPGAEAPEKLTDEALLALYAVYAGPLFTFALRLSGDPQRSEEAVQDALLRAWQHPEAVDGSRGPPRAFLYTVVRNGLIDRWRRDAARPRTSAPESLDTVTVSDEVERAVESWGVADALRRLTPEHRQVILHAFFLGHTVEQSAAALGIPAGTVKSRTYYALRALRVALEEMGYVR
jgi:RNA polymerase sigma-70 factor (ECF subfamily)